MCISVDLPEPDGPMMAVRRPSWIVERDAAQRVDGGVAVAVAARDVFAHGRSVCRVLRALLVGPARPEALRPARSVFQLHRPHLLASIGRTEALRARARSGNGAGSVCRCSGNRTRRCGRPARAVRAGEEEGERQRHVAASRAAPRERLERPRARSAATSAVDAASAARLHRAEGERERLDQPGDERDRRDQEDGHLGARGERDLGGELDVPARSDDDRAAVLGGVAGDGDDDGGDEELGQVGVPGEGVDRVRRRSRPRRPSRPWRARARRARAEATRRAARAAGRRRAGRRWRRSARQVTAR